MDKISRNELCWCGSGKKYKNCHMEYDLKLQYFDEQGYIIPQHDLIKNDEQIEGIRKSGILTKEVLDMVGDRIKSGIKTIEIDSWVHDYTIERGGYPAPLNYNGFPKSVCISINNVVCHGIPDDTVLKDGDIVNIDVTSILNGYYSDASRMFMIGKIPDTAKRLVDTARECLYKGIREVKPFTSINSIGNVIDEHAQKNGFSVVRELCGHGIGLEFHEEPQVDHYRTRYKGMIMVPGMVFTIEPMINEGHWKCRTLSDGWTVVTKDDSLSAQWEHTILVTENGAEILA